MSGQQSVDFCLFLSDSGPLGLSELRFPQLQMGLIIPSPQDLHSLWDLTSVM